MYYLNKIKNHLYNWFEYAKEHLVGIIFILTIFLIVCFAFTHLEVENVINNGVIEKQNIIILGITLENWFTWFSLISLILAAIWAVYQFDKGISRKQQEKGAEIAKLFSEDLLSKCNILGHVIIDCGINDLFKLSILNYKIFRNFDRMEFYDIYDDDQIFIKLDKLLFSNKTQQIYLSYLEERISVDVAQKIKDKKYSQSDLEKIFVLDNSTMPVTFKSFISSVLNDLEYISMYIASQSAGSKYVYQSLHQIFLKTVKLLAPIIAMQNKDYSDKYYTNIIYVYNEWAQMRETDQKKENKKKAKANKILNPKIKTV